MCAGARAYTPHDLRHRYMRQVVGHSRASITLDIYAHVLLDEPPKLLRERRDSVMQRNPRAA